MPGRERARCATTSPNASSASAGHPHRRDVVHGQAMPRSQPPASPRPKSPSSGCSNATSACSPAPRLSPWSVGLRDTRWHRMGRTSPTASVAPVRPCSASATGGATSSVTRSCPRLPASGTARVVRRAHPVRRARHVAVGAAPAGHHAVTRPVRGRHRRRARCRGGGAGLCVRRRLRDAARGPLRPRAPRAHVVPGDLQRLRPLPLRPRPTPSGSRPRHWVGSRRW